jgi:hypothetical protein
MKRQRLLVALLFLLVLVAACSSGHVGGNQIAFLRNGHLWRIDPDGSNAFEIAQASTPIIGFAWSPTHHMFFFRTLDPTFARTLAGKHLTGNTVTGLYGDAPAELDTIGINGGSPIPIQFSNASVAYSNAWWNTSSTRLLYREEFTAATSTPDTVQWWLAQDDQPGGIARKLLPYSLSIPSIAPDNSMAIGDSAKGIFTTTLTGTNQHYVVSFQRPKQPLTASLERVLWRPAYRHAAFLYALPVSASNSSSIQAAASIQLVLQYMNGPSRVLATCACTQFAWSPDGNYVVFQAGANFTILNIEQNTSFSISTDGDSMPYWSPDSHFLLLDGSHLLTLIDIATGQRQVILSDTLQPALPGTSTGAEPGVNSLLQPVSNSLWASDSRHFVFLTRGRLFWQGKQLPDHGLYTAAIDDQGRIQGAPMLVDARNDTEAGWSYEDANTSFLY